MSNDKRPSLRPLLIFLAGVLAFIAAHLLGTLVGFPYWVNAIAVGVFCYLFFSAAEALARRF